MTGQTIGALTLLVADYDEAIAFFTEGLGFALLEDTRLDEPGKPGKR
ncbi:MAG: VOC family protein, partial [Aeromonas jandaei]